MGVLQNIAAKIEAKTEAAKSSVDAGSLLTSGRFLALVGVVAIALFKLAEPAVLSALLWAFGIYTAGNTATRLGQIIMDGLIIKAAKENPPQAPPAPPVTTP
jgi:hypothetical protein